MSKRYSNVKKKQIKQKNKQTVNVKVHIDQSRKTTNKASSHKPRQEPTLGLQRITTMSIPAQMNPPSFQNMSAPPVSAPVVSPPLTVGGGNPIFVNPLIPPAGDQTLGTIAQRRAEEEPLQIDEPVEPIVTVSGEGTEFKFPKSRNYKAPPGKMWNPYSGRPIYINSNHPQRDAILEFNLAEGYIRKPEEI